MSQSYDGLKVPFGRKDDRLVAPTDDLPGGLACGCACPGCGASLILRQGRRRRHFAHHNAPVTDHCVSQAIHSAAIQVLLQARQVPIPSLAIHVKKYALSGQLVERHLELCRERTVRFEECRPEVAIKDPEFGMIRPDVVGYRGGKQLFVEVCYTHQVDDDKKAKLARLGVPAVEIDLNDLELGEGFAAIEARVLGTGYRHWLFYPGEALARRRLQDEVDAEVRRLDDIENQKRARARARAEARRAEYRKRQQAALSARLAQRQREEQRFLPFRTRPNAEKEGVLRKKLGIQGEWPYYLRLKNRDNRAIAAPPHIWQAAVFHHFIFNKPADDASFSLVDVTKWVKDWFGQTESITHDPLQAVKGLLFYLAGCGFIRYAGPGTGGMFTVQHSDLEPPARAASAPEASLPERARRTLLTPAYDGIKHTKDNVTWAREWPDYETVKRAVTRWISRSRDDELVLLDTLFKHRDELPTPLEFAALMSEQMPFTVALNFLLSHRFVA